jgi:hypothetical protein
VTIQNKRTKKEWKKMQITQEVRNGATVGRRPTIIDSMLMSIKQPSFLVLRCCEHNKDVTKMKEPHLQLCKEAALFFCGRRCKNGEFREPMATILKRRLARAQL